MEEGKDYSLGHKRGKELDMADMCFAQQDTQGCGFHLDNFMDTIPEESEAAKELKHDFDIVEIQLHHNTKLLIEELKDMGDLEKTDVKVKGNQQLLIESLHDKKIICWKVSLKYGLLYE